MGVVVWGIHLCFGQGEPVHWRYEAAYTAPHEVCVTFTASLAPGWHLYSQFLEPGGPIPTTFAFAESHDYALAGVAEEMGKMTAYHDDIYDMEIKWYKEKVSFRQRVKLFKPVSTLGGTITYMVCNGDVCIPNTQDFLIRITAEK